MGAEAEGTQPAGGEPAPAARAQPISAAQFLSWKQRKDVLPDVISSKTVAELEQRVRETISQVEEPVHFLLHRFQHDAEEAMRKAEAAQKRAADIASGAAQMNGRELFQHEPGVRQQHLLR